MDKLSNLIFFPFLLLNLSVESAFANLLEEVQQAYDPTISVSELNHASKESSSTCKVSSLTLLGTDPINLLQRSVHALYYEPEQENSSHASLVILPPISGINLLDRSDAQRFCSNGISSVIVESWDYYSEPGIEWNVHDRDTIRAIDAIRNSIEFLHGRHKGPIGIFGTSQGAIFSSLVLAVDPRVTAGAFIVGGGSIAEILAETRIGKAKEYKKLRMEKFGIKTDAEYEERLKNSLTINILELAREAKNKKVLMFIGTTDKAVPTHTQWNLWEAWSRPEEINMPFDHLPTILFTNFFYFQKILDFFNRNL